MRFQAVLAFLVFSAHTVFAQPFYGVANPSALYCTQLGYVFEVVESAGGEDGVCVFPDGSSCPSWGFLEGVCGVEHNFCSKMGLETRVLDHGSPVSKGNAVCVAGSFAPATEQASEYVGVSVIEAMGLVEDSIGGSAVQLVLGSDPNPPGVPSYMDWRDMYGADWVSPVKNQGGCGSCAVFAGVGVVEAEYNIHRWDPTYDLDLAEEMMVSGCYSTCDCSGCWQYHALNYIQDNGCPDEDCFPYTASNSACDPCADYTSRLTYLDDWATVGHTEAAMKVNLQRYGPFTATVCINGCGASWDGDIYRCSNDDSYNHAIVVVGYNDSGSYWIIKNSWGTGFGESGYYKLGYGECFIGQYVNGYFYTMWYGNMVDNPQLSVDVSPEEGNNLTLYNFTAVYRHIDYVLPESIQVNIDGVSYNLSETDALDEDPRDNKSYYYETYLSQGMHYYNFSAGDGSVTNRTPSQSLLVGYAPTLTEDGVSSEFGDVDYLFNFSVNYTDLDGDAPSAINVVVDSVGYGMHASTSSYTAGVTYYYNSTYASYGKHLFYYNTSDGTSSVSTEGGYFFVVSDSPVCDGSDPLSSSVWNIDVYTNCSGLAFVPTSSKNGFVNVSGGNRLRLDSTKVFVNNTGFFVDGVLELGGSELSFIR